jgi:uncharacterized SAM-binding protein YcdF (DUF218 family)
VSLAHLCFSDKLIGFLFLLLFSVFLVKLVHLSPERASLLTLPNFSSHGDVLLSLGSEASESFSQVVMLTLVNPLAVFGFKFLFLREIV